MVGHRADRRDGRVDRVRGRVAQVALDQHVDAVVQRGGEQHPLADLRGAVHDPLDAGQEAEVGHVVGLVEDGDLDGAEVAVALLDQVLEPAGAGDDDVEAAGERLRPAGSGRRRRRSSSSSCRGRGPAGRRRRRPGWPARGSAPGSASAAAWAAACCREAASRATSGRLKARVLPEPVRPRPSTSRPARLSGSVATWIGNGAVMPLAVSTSTSGAGTPRASKVVSVGSTVASAPTGTTTGAGTADGAAWRARAGAGSDWSPAGRPPRPRPPRRAAGTVVPGPGGGRGGVAG